MSFFNFDFFLDSIQFSNLEKLRLALDLLVLSLKSTL